MQADGHVSKAPPRMNDAGPTPRPRGRCQSANGSAVIILRKNRREPQPPRRGGSLLTSQTPRRYSAPPSGLVSATTSRPSIVRTSAITGHDPLGWKLRPLSVPSSHRAGANRLSLQIALPIGSPDPDPASEKSPALKSKASRRHHSDSFAFLRRAPAVTLEELRDVRLRPSVNPEEVFRGEEAPPRPRQKPPAVPGKSPLARQIARLIAHSWKEQMCAGRKNAAEETRYGGRDKAKSQSGEASCSLRPIERYPLKK
ncbi:uncharacterized protein LOC144093197 [Stigmatopora argus]